jgi:RimJ/RimL family protein N-acetyltransferase
MSDTVIETERLVLRSWLDNDLAPFAAMNADPAVMTHLDGVIDTAASAAMMERLRDCDTQDGCTFWALERRDDSAFLGFCGLRIGGHPGTPVNQVLEIGWRLCIDAWGHGYAGEAARASLEWGWVHKPHDRILAWTVPANERSWRLMERIGMVHEPSLDFNHPRFADAHPLCRHITYSIGRPA